MRKMTTPWTFLLLTLLLSHALSEPESSIAPMEKTEQQALYSVIQDLVGKWWNGSDLYPDPCGWTQIQGVSCDLFDGLWYVTTLSIGPILENSLECAEDPKFNPLLFELKHLKTLSFFNCLSSHKHITLPSSNWEKLAGSLENLEFRSNRALVGEVPTNLGQLSNLKSLVLVENSLFGKLPMELGKLTHLKRLILSGNKFSGAIPAPLFNKWTELLILDLSMNSLNGSLPTSLGSLSSLLKLDLSNNQFNGGLPPDIGNLRQLSLLDLRNNSLSGASPKSLMGMESLEDLLLSYNPWGGDLVEFEFENLRNLTTLDLSHMGLTGTIPEAIASLKRLRYLALDYNHLSGSVPSKFAALPSLTALYLNGNNLTGSLEFPERFYRRMGKRFASWNNPNLCYNAVVMDTGNVPHGIAQCKQGQEPSTGISNSNTRVDSGNPEENSGLVATSWLPASSVSGIWWGILVQEAVIMSLLVMFL
ncbi:piriformospora indica-insensitive protein 2-like [Canna indica]|uniref:Piriformospora indica-insensitive protein 2-like n=1 Tax=Canna indica TaxID=4628 RepID=A0AAQ3K8D9_9LILI|nr:piriformospora indica-insensitive protein 2-like [Canna indica]